MDERSRLHKLLKEPLIHFLGGALLVFGFFWATGTDRDPADYAIAIDTPDIARLKAEWTQNFRRDPTQAELDGLIDQEIAEEIYYREALRLGLDKNDPVIRRRLFTKMRFLNAQEAEGTEPSDEILQKWMDKNPAKYAASSRYSFEQVYLGQNASKESVLRGLGKLNSSEEIPDNLRKPLSLPLNLVKTSSEDTARQFGQKFADRLSGLPLGEWAGPVQSGFGQHLVRISEKVPSNTAKLNDVRETVLNDWRAEQKRSQEQADFEKYRAQYDITVAGRK